MPHRVPHPFEKCITHRLQAGKETEEILSVILPDLGLSERSILLHPYFSLNFDLMHNWCTTPSLSRCRLQTELISLNLKKYRLAFVVNFGQVGFHQSFPMVLLRKPINHYRMFKSCLRGTYPQDKY